MLFCIRLFCPVMKRIIIAVALLLSAMQLPAITLEDCYRMVRENYPLIHQYGLTEKMSRYSFENAAAGYIPHITLSAQASYQSDAVAFPEEFNSLLKMAGIEMDGMPKDLYKVQLEISQTLWDGGYARAQREAVKAEQEVSRLTLDKDMDALKTRVNQMYFGILVMEANLKANIGLDTLMTSNMRVVESAVENGTAMQSDIDKVKVEILSLRQQRVQIENTLKTYKEMLAIMIGRKIEDDEVFEKPEIQLVDLSMNRRAELLLFDAQIRQIESRKKMLDVAVMPKFALFAQGWYGRPGLNMFNDMMYNKLTWNGVAGITMKWDITGFYTRRNDRRKIELSQRSVAAQRDAFKWNTDIQQTQIRNEIDRMYRLKESDEEIVRLRTSVRKASESRYRNGVITLNDLLRDMTEENNAVISSSLHELELLKNIYDLKVVLNQ